MDSGNPETRLKEEIAQILSTIQVALRTDPNIAITETIENLTRQLLAKVPKTFGEDDYLHDSRHIADLAIKYIDERMRNPGTLPGFLTGFPTLDSTLGGWEKQNVYNVNARPGVGKCLSEDMIVENPSSGERMTIKQAVHNKLPSIHNLVDGMVVVNSISDWVYNGVQDCFKVTTLLGRTIEVTIEHPFLTTLGWIPLKHLVVGDKIAIPRKVPSFGQNKFELETARLLGYMVSTPLDDPEKWDDYSMLLRKHFGKNYVIGQMMDFMLQYYPEADGLPAIIWTFDEIALKAFVEAIMSENEYNAPSEKMAQDMYDALIRLGITALLDKKTVVVIRKNDGDVLRDEIVSIEKVGPKKVYDLCVPNGSNFVSQGIFVHNTTLLLQWAWTLANQTPTIYFSPEARAGLLSRRLIGALAGVPMKVMRRGELTDEQRRNAGKAAKLISTRKIYFYDMPSVNTAYIERIINRVERELGQKVGAILVDYLQQMEGEDDFSNLTSHMKSLEETSFRQNVALLMASQVGRGSGDGTAIDAGKGTGKIEELSTAMMALTPILRKGKPSQEPEDQRRRTLFCAKNREEGVHFRINLVSDPVTGWMDEENG